MSRQLLDYDALTGTATYTHTPDETTIAVETKVDVSPMLERNLKLRNEGAYDKGNEGWHKYCDLDDVLIMKLMQRGINMARPTNSDWKKFFQVMETDYPYYKVTNKKAWKPTPKAEDKKIWTPA